MHLDIVQSLSIAGDSAKANDDRAGAGHARAWVIDGATDLGDPGLVGSRGGAATQYTARHDRRGQCGHAPPDAGAARLACNQGKRRYWPTRLPPVPLGV